MEMKFRLTRRRVALFAAALAVVATGSIGWAAVGDGGTIQGCVAQNGTIDALDETTLQCKERQTNVEWYTKAGADAAFLGKSEKAADADKLDGLDSTAFARGSVEVRTDKVDVAFGQEKRVELPPFGGLRISCDHSGEMSGEFYTRSRFDLATLPVQFFTAFAGRRADGSSFAGPSSLVFGFPVPVVGMWTLQGTITDGTTATITGSGFVSNFNGGCVVTYSAVVG